MMHEENARLLRQLAINVGASDYGAIGNFFEVSPDWCCPCCHRSKVEIARLDKNAHLLCALHWHHDHFELYVPQSAWVQGITESFLRFQNTLICNDCNVAEPVAKNIVAAPEHFSFAPYEIASFIDVTPNAPHGVDPARAHAAYEAAKPAMHLIGRRLRALKAAIEKDEPFEPIAAAAARVIKNLRVVK